MTNVGRYERENNPNRRIPAALIDGKMQDDATWKQAEVMVDLARRVAERYELTA